MTRARVAAAVAAIVTALLLQATVVSPATYPWPISLPAVLVAAVALCDGAGTGIAFGFATGLIADLGSRHPAGLLALCWLGVGLVCGLAADRHPVRRDAAVAGLVCGAAGVAVTVLLALVHSGGLASSVTSALTSAVTSAVPSCLGNGLLALLIAPLVRAALHTVSLRAPHAVPDGLLLGANRV